MKEIGEIMARHWARESQDAIDDFDPLLDFFLGICIYGDKTGTDVNLWYPLARALGFHSCSSLAICLREVTTLEASRVCPFSRLRNI